MAHDREVSAAKSTNGPAGLVGHRFERPAGPLLIQLLWCLAPPKDPVRRVQLAGIARSFNRGLLSDQLLVKISAFGQGPTAKTVKEFPLERETGAEATDGDHQFQTPVATAELRQVLDCASNSVILGV